MRTLRFSSLYLLSQNERRGLQVSFPSKKTVLIAPNDFGKSAVVKSLYDTFGAQPRKIDASWREARVDSLIEFTVDDKPFAILKALGGYTVFDGERQPLIRASSIGRDLAPFLADLFDFQLVMPSHGVDKQSVVPSPQYMFAPFYIDQDEWNEPWSSFENLNLQSSVQTLAYFHSGLRPNAYYQAMTRRAPIRAEIKKLEAERHVFGQTLRSLQTIVSDVVLSYDLDDFRAESEQLIAESEQLHAEQVKYRKRLTALAEETRLWCQQRDIVKRAIAEMDADLADALDRPTDVACPTCGHHYANSIAEHFNLVEDKDGLIQALSVSTEKLHELDHKSIEERDKRDRIQARIDNIQHILGVQKESVSLRDVIAVEGRNEAVRIIRDRLHTKDAEIADKKRLEQEQTDLMGSAVSQQRTAEIRDFFYTKLEAFAHELDVRLGGGRKANITSISLGRGSEGPRGLITYFYAFLHTARRYSSSAFCPIVIDAPNQQGQDSTHLPQIMRFIVDRQPEGSQLVIATEQLLGLGASEVDVQEVGAKRHQVLREDAYAAVSDSVRPYLNQLL